MDQTIQSEASGRRGAAKILPEVFVVLFVGITLAFMANQISPRGLVLTRNYFPAGASPPMPLAARTGSIFLNARSGTGRALSVLPPVHLAVARAEELVADLAEGLRVWQNQPGSNLPSNSFIISGPSRTSDIEKVLVLGAHGPKRVITLLLA